MRVKHPVWLGVLLALGLGVADAWAQSPMPMPEPDPEPDPGAGAGGGGGGGGAAKDDEADPELDQDILTRSIVQTAMKARITIAEAPAVIHVLTDKDLSDFGFRSPHEAMLYVPGFLDANAQFDAAPSWLVLGVMQGVLYLRDGVSMFDPYFNIPGTMRRSPMEVIKRIEAMTSPGGVLWGANSFLGIVNVSTKDPEDVKGFEFGLGGGHGLGDQQVIRPWGMWGQTFFGGKLGVLAHWSLEWFKGPVHRVVDPWLIASPAALPAANSFRFPAGLDSTTPTSFYSQFDGKIRYTASGGVQRLTLGWQLQFHKMIDLARTIKDKSPRYWNGLYIPIGTWGSPLQTNSPIPAVSRSAFNLQESYAYLAYQNRWASNRLGLDAKGYYVRFDRTMDPIVFLPYTNDLIPGAANRVIAAAHRAGATADMDLEVTRSFKLQWGGELFYEWIKDADTNFIAPIDRNGQPNYGLLGIISCPYYNTNGDNVPVYDANDPTKTNYVPGCSQRFVFDSDRLVYGLFAAADYKPHKSLRLTAGVRLQHGPFGNVPYAPQPLYAAAAVWNFYEELFLKVNFATGFRPPVFNSASGNPEGGNYTGYRDLRSEESQSVKAEFNAKLFKNRARVREFVFRLNYSYTRLLDMIRMVGGGYINSPARAIHAGELLADLSLKGDHRLVLAYTYLRQNGSSPEDGGMIRAVPNHWLAASSVFNLLHIGRWRLDLNVTFRLIGPFQDPNQLLLCQAGSDYCSSRPSDRVYDPIQPAAILNGGLRLGTSIAGKPLVVSANFYNVLNGTYYTSDYFNDLAATIEALPMPGQRFYFFLEAKMKL